MSLFDTLFGNGGKSAADAMSQGNQNAMNYLNPYYQGGLDDYNTYRNYISNMGKTLDQYGNPADWMYKQINQSPNDYYQTLMKGYTETPQAKYEQDQMMKAVNQGASASGMLGSGSYYNDLENNTHDIVSRDQQQYFNNMLSTNNQQMNYLNNFQGQQAAYRNSMAGLASMGYNAAMGMGNYAQQQGQANAMGKMSNANMWNNLIGGGAGLFAGLL